VGVQKFVKTTAGIEHRLVLSNWQTDRKGVPSFDYVYEQRAGACQFRLAGHVVGVTEEVRGKVELIVYNGQDDKGREAPSVVAFDSDDLVLSLPFKEVGPLHKVGLVSRLTPEQQAHACAKGNDEGLRVGFRK
jgi:hypothetical protein